MGEFDVGHKSNSPTLTKIPNLKSKDNLPPFLMNFPQHLNSSLETPYLNQRRSYLVHYLGLITLITLDSGSFFKVNDENQLNFLENTLKQSISTLRFVIYSESLYPSCVKRDQSFNFKKSRLYWTPLFDKYDVSIFLLLLYGTSSTFSSFFG